MKVSVDTENDEDVDRLVHLVLKHGYQFDRTRVGNLAAALEEFATTPRCVAHGNYICADCSRIEAQFFSDGECTQCSTYGSDGMHWDTCRARLRGPVYANLDEARRGAK